MNANIAGGNKILGNVYGIQKERPIKSLITLKSFALTRHLTRLPNVSAIHRQCVDNVNGLSRDAKCIFSNKLFAKQNTSQRERRITGLTFQLNRCVKAVEELFDHKLQCQTKSIVNITMADLKLFLQVRGATVSDNLKLSFLKIAKGVGKVMLLLTRILKILMIWLIAANPFLYTVVNNFVICLDYCIVLVMSMLVGTLRYVSKRTTCVWWKTALNP